MTDRQSTQPIFIVGVGRSGTSLIQSILASHPDIYFPPETGLLRRFIFARRIPRFIDVNSLPLIWDLLSGDKRFSRLRIGSLDELRKLLRIGGGINAINFYERVVAANARPGKIIGDKDPRLVEFLPLIHSAWPGAYVIHVIRDPRDVAASKKTSQWSQEKPFWYHLLANRYQFAVGRKDGNGLFQNRYIEVFYEELLQDATIVVRRLCESLNIRFVPEMLSFSIEAKRLVADDEVAWKKETLGPLLKGNSGKWKTKLSLFEIAATEAVCTDALSANEHCVPASSKHRTLSGPGLIASTYALLIIMASYLYMPLRWLRLRRFGSVT